MCVCGKIIIQKKLCLYIMYKLWCKIHTRPIPTTMTNEHLDLEGFRFRSLNINHHFSLISKGKFSRLTEQYEQNDFFSFFFFLGIYILLFPESFIHLLCVCICISEYFVTKLKMKRKEKTFSHLKFWFDSYINIIIIIIIGLITTCMM